MSIVHIEGMGVIGSFLAQELAQRNIDFTWHDNDVTLNAYSASTGCVYPSADPFDAANYAAWLEWSKTSRYALFTESANYWYATKNPPHGLKEKPIALDVGMRLYPVPSIHFNPQAFVNDTRNKFKARRIAVGDVSHSDAWYVVAHGFSTRLRSYLWGWSAVVSVEIDGSHSAFTSHSRHCFNFQTSRYVFDYLYPRANSPYYYLGTSMISQSLYSRRELTTEQKINTALHRIKQITSDLVRVTKCHSVCQGWRPQPQPWHTPETGLVWQDPYTKKLHVKPMGANGVRHAPALIQSILEHIEL